MTLSPLGYAATAPLNSADPGNQRRTIMGSRTLMLLKEFRLSPLPATARSHGATCHERANADALPSTSQPRRATLPLPLRGVRSKSRCNVRMRSKHVGVLGLGLADGVFGGARIGPTSWQWRTEAKRNVVRASMRFDPGGGGPGGGGDNGVGRVVVNLAIAGGLTYLTVTGKLGWVFDAFVSLWLFVVLVPIVAFIAFLWFADREIVSSNCPNCGNPFQVLEFTMKDEEEQFCPYCSQPFKLEGKQFVRDGPSFSKKQGFRQPFGQPGFGSPFGGSDNRKTTTSSTPSDPPGVIVDVEAEVVDQD